MNKLNNFLPAIWASEYLQSSLWKKERWATAMNQKENGVSKKKIVGSVLIFQVLWSKPICMNKMNIKPSFY